jgi:hypothetical protein
VDLTFATHLAEGANGSEHQHVVGNDVRCGAAMDRTDADLGG